MSGPRDERLVLVPAWALAALREAAGGTPPPNLAEALALDLRPPGPVYVTGRAVVIPFAFGLYPAFTLPEGSPVIAVRSRLDGDQFAIRDDPLILELTGLDMPPRVYIWVPADAVIRTADGAPAAGDLKPPQAVRL